LNADTDRRDHKFLSGSITPDGLHSYCGGLEAAISRACIYAQHANVVGINSANSDLFEAAAFAARVKTLFPKIQLAFVHAPRPDGKGWNELEHRILENRLHNLGYDYYAVTQFGRTVFPSASISGSWVIIDDAQPIMSRSPVEFARAAS
jgi:isocitrate lyase